MAKHAVFVALFLALIAIANASTYTTVITTTEADEDNQGGGMCMRELRQKSLSHCRMYLQQERPYEPALKTVTNPTYQEEHLLDCCQQLENVSEDCRCEAIRRLVREQQQYGGGYETESRQMMQRAQRLPQQCRFERPRNAGSGPSTSELRHSRLL